MAKVNGKYISSDYMDQLKVLTEHIKYPKYN